MDTDSRAFDGLALEGVCVRYGAVKALDGFGLRAARGAVTMLAGPNGAGKSTLIRVLLGLVAADEGRMRYGGETVRADIAFRRRLGYLPEAVAFSDSLTGREVMRFFASARGVARDRVELCLERVGLAAVAKRVVRGYSRGMRQRLGLAVALVADPEILVLDEPTGGLDQDALTILWSVLDEWRSRGRVVLLASHEIGLLEPRVDDVALLAGGRLLVQGTPAALRDAAALPARVTLRLAESLDGARASAWVRASGVTSAAHLSVHGEEISLEVAPAELVRLLDARTSLGVAVTDVRVAEAPFDEVYRRLLELRA